jgi:heme/copper-type cytochrome/quinol oxidase subunit 4
MGDIALFALLSAIYPTLVAATSVMLLLPRAEDLMVGFWLGSILTSLAFGLAIVLELHGSKVVKTTRHTVSPAVDLVIAGLLVLAAVALARGEDERLRARREARHPRAQKKPPKWQQKLRAGNPWHTFVVGIVLSFPGLWYLAALDRLIKLHYSTVAEILVVIGFCLVQLALIELPLLAFKIWPKQTPIAIDRVKAWASRHGRQYGVWGLAIIAGLLAIVGVIGLLR